MADGGSGGTDGETRDDFEGLVLDESFVRQAEIVELSAARRRKAARQARRSSRRRTRLRWRTRLWFRRYQLASVALLVVAAYGVAQGVQGRGPFRYLDRADSPVAARVQAVTEVKDDPAADPASSTTSTTEYHLERRSYLPGQCVKWDQRRGEDTRATPIVGCDQPHLVEMAGRILLTNPSGDPYPSDEAWDMTFEASCRPIAEAYVGYPLARSGRFFPSGVIPSHESWGTGDRDVWCGVAQRTVRAAPRSPDDQLELVAGAVKGAPQQLLYGTGTCLRLDGDGQIDQRVPCEELHAYEITGAVDLSGKIDHPPTDADLERLVYPACRRLAVSHLGHALPASIQAGWFGIDDDLWAAGGRSVECEVAKYQGDAPQHVTGPLAGVH